MKTAAQRSEAATKANATRRANRAAAHKAKIERAAAREIAYESLTKTAQSTLEDALAEIKSSYEYAMNLAADEATAELEDSLRLLRENWGDGLVMVAMENTSTWIEYDNPSITRLEDALEYAVEEEDANDRLEDFVADANKVYPDEIAPSLVEDAIESQVAVAACAVCGNPTVDGACRFINHKNQQAA